MLVAGWLSRAAATHPERTAIETPSAAVSYGELHARALAGARALALEGVQAGDRVAIALPGGLGFAEALHACLLLGAVAVPIDVRGSAAERARLASGSALQIDEPGTLGGLAERARAHARALSTALGEKHDLDATAVVIHTSGTTSQPRPVELTYGNILWSAVGSAVALGLDDDERWLCALPVSHVGGLSILLRSAIYATTALVHERFETAAVLGALSERGVTLVSLVATTLTRLLDAGLREPPALRCALTGGGPVGAPLVERALAAAVPVGLTYGLTEACSQVTTTPIAAVQDAARRRAGALGTQDGGEGGLGTQDGGEGGLGTQDGGEGGLAALAGPPLFCTQVRIEGRPGRPADAHGEGEILVRGPTVAGGAREGEGWLHTGDVGRLDGRGRLLVSGRRADTIVTGGENVAPAEVEAVLEAHPGVLEAAVLGRADERWGEAVTALVVARADHVIDGESLREHCRRALAPHKVPKSFVLAAGPLPRTASGKLLRGELLP